MTIHDKDTPREAAERLVSIDSTTNEDDESEFIVQIGDGVYWDMTIVEDEKAAQEVYRDTVDWLTDLITQQREIGRRSVLPAAVCNCERVEAK